MNQLTLSFLGSPELFYNEEPLTFRTRKAVALLVYLATEAGQHSRETLATLFWPESNRKRGRGMLRTTLRHLRQGMDKFDESYLIVERQSIRFSADPPCDFDLHLVEEALQQVEQQPAPHERDAFIAQLQQAIERVRGDFLAGFTLADSVQFDDWVAVQREMWHQRIGRLFDALTQALFERGDLAVGIETALRWEAHDPLDEAATACLMQMQFADNNRAAALQSYAAYETRLDLELGVAPSAEIKALATRIKSAAVPVQTISRVVDRAEPELRFVGRGQELSQLQTVYKRVASGSTQVALITGEAGIGKSRLAAEFLQWATANGADVVRGRAFEVGGQLTYQPLIQWLRWRLARETDLLALLSPTWLAELSRILPELRDRYPELAEPQQKDETAQLRLFEAMAQVGRALAERTPLLIFLDDIQWIDTASLDALQFMLASWGQADLPILLLLNARPAALSGGSQLQGWLAQNSLMLMRLSLDYLTFDDTLRLVTGLRTNRETLTLQALDTFATALFTETKGHPFFVAETLKALQEQNTLIPVRDEHEQIQWRTLSGESQGQLPFLRVIPVSIRQAVLDRVARLTPHATMLLTNAAVLGQQATFEQLCTLSDVDKMTGLDALETLLSKRLLIESREFNPTYVIAHDITRTVVYEETSKARKRILHQRALSVLDDTTSARLAYHALAAGQIETGFRHTIAAGDNAFAFSAGAEAANHYQTAYRLLNEAALPEPTTAEYEHLFMRLGRALELSGQFETALEVYEALAQIGREKEAPKLELAALVGQIGLLAAGGSPLFQPERAEPLLTQAQELVQLVGNREAEATILWRMCQLYTFLGRSTEAIACGEEALVLARQLGLDELAAYILGELTMPNANKLQVRRADEVARQATAYWDKVENHPMQADSLSKSAVYQAYFGEYQSALALSDKAFAISQRIDNLWGQSFSRLVTGMVHWERGYPGRAIAVMEKTIENAETGDLSFGAFIQAQLASVYGWLGRVDTGIELAQNALESAEAQMPIMRVEIGGRLTRLYLLKQETQTASEIVDRYRQGSMRTAHPFWAVAFPLAEIHLFWHLENYDAVLRTTEAYCAMLRQSGMQMFLPQALFYRGRALLASGKTEPARACWQEARAVAEKIGARYWLQHILVALSGIVADSAESAHLHQQANALLSDIVTHTPEMLRATFTTQVEAVRYCL